MNKITFRVMQFFLIATLLMSYRVAHTAAVGCVQTITGSGNTNGNWQVVVTSLSLEQNAEITFSATHEAMSSNYIALQYTGASSGMTDTMSTDITWTTTVAVAGTYGFEVLAHGNFTFSLSYTSSTGCNPQQPSGNPCLSLDCGTGSSTEEAIPVAPRDTRLCRSNHYAVYANGNSIEVYRLNESKGFFALSVSQAELEALPGKKGVNTLIKSSSDGQVRVYRLETSNTYQVHIGMEIVRFNGLPAAQVFCGTVSS